MRILSYLSANVVTSDDLTGLKMKCTYRSTCFETEFIALYNKTLIRNIIELKIVIFIISPWNIEPSIGRYNLAFYMAYQALQPGAACPQGSPAITFPFLFHYSTAGLILQTTDFE